MELRTDHSSDASHARALDGFVQSMHLHLHTVVEACIDIDRMHLGIGPRAKLHAASSTR